MLDRIARDARDEGTQVVGAADGRPFTRNEAARAFSFVENAQHWKLAIDTTLTEREIKALGGRALVREAVIFFTGSVPTIEHVAGGLRVRAAGYYAAVGA